MRISRNMQYVGLALLALVTAVVVVLALQTRQEQSPANAGEPVAAAQSDVPVLSVIGDSYTGGSEMGGTGQSGWVPQVADILSTNDKRVEYTKTGLGGSGYVTRGPSDKIFGEVVEETFGPKSDVVMFFGSINDLGQPVDEIGAAAAEAYAEAKADYPDATLVVAGPAWMNPDVPQELAAINAELEAQAKKAGAVWIDPLAEGWFQDRPELIGDDGTHPTNKGHRYMAEQFAPHLKPLLD